MSTHNPPGVLTPAGQVLPTSNTSAPAAAPTTKQRLAGIDVSRGLALLGMMAVHALIPFDKNYNPNWVTYVAMGNASAVFALLAGVGLSLTTGRTAVSWSKASSTAASIGGRALAIGLIGLLLGYTDAEIAGVILPYYAIMFLLAIPLLFLRSRSLVVIGVLAAVVVPVLSLMIRPALPEATLANPSFIQLFDHPLQLLSELAVTGAYPALPWVSYICAGLIVGRLTLSSLTVARRLLVSGLVLAVAATTVSYVLLGPLGGRAALRLAAPGPLNPDGDDVDDLLTFGFDGTTPTGSWWWLATSAPHAATPPDLLRTIGIALAVLGTMLLLGHVTAPAWRRGIQLVSAPVAAAGTMTLTLYTAHVVFMNSPLDEFDPVGGYLFQLVAVLLFALGWRKAVGRGPLETAVTAFARMARGWAEQAFTTEHASSSQRASLAERASSTGGDGAFSTERTPSEHTPAVASPAPAALTWWDAGTGSADEMAETGSGRPRRAAPPGRRRAAFAPQQDSWAWWEDGTPDTSAHSSKIAGVGIRPASSSSKSFTSQPNRNRTTGAFSEDQRKS